MARLTRRQRRKLRKALQETAAGAVIGLGLGALVIAGFVFDDSAVADAPEHYGQVEYCGVWWDVEDYEAMMAEREEYLAEEAAEDEALLASIRAAQESQDTGTLITDQGFTSEDSYMLAKIAMAEAEGEDTEGKALVMRVVLNRIQSEDFPDTVWEVITEEGQFTAYENGRYDRVEPDDDCYKALALIKDGWDENQGALYFERTSDTEIWHNTTLSELFTHGNHTFYKEAEG